MPTAHRYAMLFAVFTPLAVVACGSSVVERNPSDTSTTTTAPGGGGGQGGAGQGGAGLGGQGAGGEGGSEPECPDTPPYCIVPWTIDENGCMVCDPISCSDCNDEQICSTCYYANGTTHACHDVPVPPPGEFLCKWTTCPVGSLCLDIQPAGDGCESVGCDALPADCVADPTCACVEPLFPNNAGCSEDADGNITLTGYFF